MANTATIRHVNNLKSLIGQLPRTTMMEDNKERQTGRLPNKMYGMTEKKN